MSERLEKTNDLGLPESREAAQIRLLSSIAVSLKRIADVAENARVVEQITGEK